MQFYSSAFRSILMRAETRELVEKQTKKMEQRANSLQRFGNEQGYSSTVFPGNFGGGRWVGVVRPDNYSGYHDNATNDTLAKAYNGGG